MDPETSGGVNPKELISSHQSELIIKDLLATLTSPHGGIMRHPAFDAMAKWEKTHPEITLDPLVSEKLAEYKITLPKIYPKGGPDYPALVGLGSLYILANYAGKQPDLFGGVPRVLEGIDLVTNKTTRRLDQSVNWIRRKGWDETTQARENIFLQTFSKLKDIDYKPK